MSTPTIVLFSKIKHPYRETLPAILSVLPKIEIEVEKIGKLGLDQDGDLGFLGEVYVESYIDFLDMSVKWNGFALCCVAYPLNDRVYIYFWHDNVNYYLSIEVPETASTFETEEYEAGNWLKRFLLEVSSVIQANICVYGRPYDKELFSSLEEEEILEKIRNGSIFSTNYPNVYLISDSLINYSKIKNLFNIYKKSERQNYSLSVLGYHVLSFL